MQEAYFYSLCFIFQNKIVFNLPSLLLRGNTFSPCFTFLDRRRSKMGIFMEPYPTPISEIRFSCYPFFEVYAQETNTLFSSM